MFQPLENEIVALLEVFHTRLLAEKKNIAKGFSLTPGQVAIIGFLNPRGSKTVPQIARRLRVSRQNVQVTINKLLEKGLVYSSANPDHLLSPLFSLTETGRGNASAIGDREAHFTSQVFEKTNIGEKTFLKMVLQNLNTS